MGQAARHVTLDIVSQVREVSPPVGVQVDPDYKGKALAEANRYLAALYTAVVYDQPACVDVMLRYLGRQDAARHSFFAAEGATSERLNAGDLANTLGQGAL